MAELQTTRMIAATFRFSAIAAGSNLLNELVLECML